ncbi:MAG: substrate-binding domain-containing protein, partial [Steroidobacteraceae bacterium]
AARDYSLLLAKITQPPAGWITGLIKTRRADGVIVIGQSLHHGELNEAAASDIGMVVWGARLKGQRYVTVGSDNEGGAYSATSHLIDQGCRRIVFLGDPAVPEVRSRLDGHLRALSTAGIGRVAGLEVPVRFGSDAAYDGVSALLDAHAEFDGVFACSDVIAMSAVRALIERGRRVPADVAVVGFDDIPLAAYTTPPLTTVRQNCNAGARALVDRLLQVMAGHRVEPEVIPTELVVRASSLRTHHQHTGAAQPRPPAAKRRGRPDSLYFK